MTKKWWVFRDATNLDGTTQESKRETAMSAEEDDKEVKEVGKKKVDAEEASKKAPAGAGASGEAPAEAADADAGGAVGGAAADAPLKGGDAAAPAKTSISEDLAEARRKAQEV